MYYRSSYRVFVFTVVHEGCATVAVIAHVVTTRIALRRQQWLIGLATKDASRRTSYFVVVVAVVVVCRHGTGALTITG